jgi:plastocyanin
MNRYPRLLAIVAAALLLGGLATSCASSRSRDYRETEPEANRSGAPNPRTAGAEAPPAHDPERRSSEAVRPGERSQGDRNTMPESRSWESDRSTMPESRPETDRSTLPESDRSTLPESDRGTIPESGEPESGAIYPERPESTPPVSTSPESGSSSCLPPEMKSEDSVAEGSAVPEGAPGAEADEPAREIQVEAREHEFVPSHFQIAVGETVKFVVKSEDSSMLHTFSVKKSKDDRTDLFSLDVPGGTVRTHVFTAQTPGKLYLYCKTHENKGMVGSITVEEGPEPAAGVEESSGSDIESTEVEETGEWD